MTDPMSEAELQWHQGRPSDVPSAVAYRVLQLRVDVFVVEQRCYYRELDGRDLEPDAEWVWVTSGDSVVGTLRILHDEATGTARIGRVATAADARSFGLGGQLMRRALELIDKRDPAPATVLDAQSHLESWYGRFGFARSGEEFMEDGIPHLPMRRPAP